jgi:hypothetical protein
VITVDASTAFAGNVFINAGNGNDTIKLQGTIGGNLTVLGGLGNDTISIIGDLTVGGNVTASDIAGSNDIDFQADATVGGNFSATGVNDFTLNANKLNVGNNLTVSAVPSGAPLNFTTAAGSLLSVGKALTVNGYAAADSFSVLGEIQVGGNTTFNLGNGTNSVNITVSVPSTLAGNFRYTGGVGDDTVTIPSGLTIGGNSFVALGEGTNTLGLAAFNLAVGFAANGNITVTGGNGSNSVTFGTTGAFNGNINVTLGNGSNSLFFNTSPVFGKITYRGGNGINGVGFASVPTVLDVDLTFGNNPNPLSNSIGFSGGAMVFTGIVRGSGLPGANVIFNFNGTIFAPNLQLIGFPS